VIFIIAVNAETDPRHYLEDGAAAAQNIALMAHRRPLAEMVHEDVFSVGRRRRRRQVERI
jgi:hypothetical protein